MNLCCYRKDLSQRITQLMNYTYLIFFAVSASILSCTSSTLDQTEDTFIIQGETGRMLDTTLTPYIEELRNITDNTAAVAIGITKGSEIIYARTFGYADVANRKKSHLNTIFHIASVSKPFTAVAVSKLIQQGKLNLDDRLIDHIPEFKMKGTGHDSVTIKHILTHTSGIPRHVSSDDWSNPIYGPAALEVNLKHVADLSLDFSPGTQFNYSNSAFDILGIVVSRVSGMRFTDYVRTNVLEPGGMLHTTYIKPKGSLPEHWAVPHSYGVETDEWAPYPYTENYAPSSGVQTTLLDMCRWGLLHLGSGTHQEFSILDKAHYRLMTTPHHDTPWGDKIGLSWYLQSYLDRPCIMHLGADTGFEANMYIYPEEDISIVVMANRDFSRVGRITLAAAEILFNEQPKEYAVSGRYPFATAYKNGGIEKAKEVWEAMKKDTVDQYYIDNDDLLTAGAILENNRKWADAQSILDYYLTINDRSSYAHRLIGNAHLNLGDTLAAISSYQKTLEINPAYAKGQAALDAIRQ